MPALTSHAQCVHACVIRALCPFYAYTHACSAYMCDADTAINMAHQDNLLQVIEGYERNGFEMGETFMRQSLEAATLSDNHECVAKLVKLGAKNIDECLALAAKEKGGVTNATAMLLLMKAALTGDKTLLPMASFDRVTSSTLEQELRGCSQTTDLVTESVEEGEISTSVALEVAQRSGQHGVKRALLLSTKVDRIKESVDWSKLRLVGLDVQLLHSLCDWLKRLDLSGNMLKRVPEEMSLLSKVRLP